jgi:hypothetical protein
MKDFKTGAVKGTGGGGGAIFENIKVRTLNGKV